MTRIDAQADEPKLLTVDPVGRIETAAVAKDGTLLIADDTGGTIWRVEYAGNNGVADEWARMSAPNYSEQGYDS